MSDITNDDRISWAEAALNIFIAETGLDAIDDYAISDLIANIGDYCLANDIDYLATIARAIGHWHAENRSGGNDDIDYMPAVRITIDGSQP